MFNIIINIIINKNFKKILLLFKKIINLILKIKLLLLLL